MLLYGSDLLSKWLVYLADLPAKQGHPVIIIPHVLDFHFVKNKGIAYGMLQEHPSILTVFIGIAILFVGYLIWSCPREKKWELYGYYGILGGALGNYTDRLYNGYVTDFIHMLSFPYHFNIADSAISISIGFIILQAVIDYRTKKNAPSTDHT